MQTQAIEKFSMWARNKLREGVEQRAYDYALDPAAPNAEPKDATTVNGRVLSNEERAMRTELAGRIERDGYAQFVEEMAYTWFNRMVAIRFMELHGYLPSHVRIFSSAEDGAEFSPQALSEALTVAIDGLDRDRVFACMDAADDEALFRELLLAQCNELAGFLPRVFGRVGGADALMLPANLLKPEGVPAHLVQDIPVELWDDVEILGWMYQFYNKELKDAFFASKRKAAPEDLAPATQLFTPEWIVRYMVDNSLGRLWMLNHPDSRLVERAQAENPADHLMEYYIQPDEEHEDFIRVTSPEDITFCDPACGSGHILVYAFKMLMAIYEECGYRTRDIPELILTKNLSGMEIDPRAAQIATLALAMCAREHDRRLFSRNVKANICVLQSMKIDADALAPTSPLRERQELLEALEHLSETGSLFAPTDDDIAALEGDLRESSVDDLFSARANENVDTALSLCKALNRRFDVVVANPPYMGSSSFNPFMSKWMKKHYPDSCKDLCTAFIERGYTLVRDNGYAAMVTMQSWMFLGSFEKMRQRVIDEKTILTMAHLGPRAFDAIGGEVVSVTAAVLCNSVSHMKGAYFRLVDIVGGEPKREKLLEAISSPTCGWFYRADASTFHDIPGTPIAYWASEGCHSAFNKFEKLSTCLNVRQGLAAGDNEKFLREWWEVPSRLLMKNCSSVDMAIHSTKRWFPLTKGGGFRKWGGSLEWVLRFDKKAYVELADSGNHLPSKQFYFLPGLTWTRISSGAFSMRYAPAGCIPCAGGSIAFCSSYDNALYLLASLNSSASNQLLSFLAPTLNFTEGAVANTPSPLFIGDSERIIKLSSQCVDISMLDWDSQETSWDFRRNPLV